MLCVAEASVLQVTVTMQVNISKAKEQCGKDPHFII